jgi:hypothetical protein
VDLSEDGHLDRVGYFLGWTNHGLCGIDGVTLMDGDSIQDSPRNKSLINAQAQSNLGACRGTLTFLVPARGRIYAEIDTTAVRYPTRLVRSLFRVTSTGVENICRIVARPAYSWTIPRDKH